jgi:hypothetical protein
VPVEGKSNLNVTFAKVTPVKKTNNNTAENKTLLVKKAPALDLEKENIKLIDDFVNYRKTLVR